MNEILNRNYYFVNEAEFFNNSNRITRKRREQRRDAYALHFKARGLPSRHCEFSTRDIIERETSRVSQQGANKNGEHRTSMRHVRTTQGCVGRKVSWKVGFEKKSSNFLRTLIQLWEKLNPFPSARFRKHVWIGHQLVIYRIVLFYPLARGTRSLYSAAFRSYRESCT